MEELLTQTRTPAELLQPPSAILAYTIRQRLHTAVLTKQCQTRTFVGLCNVPRERDGPHQVHQVQRRHLISHGVVQHHPHKRVCRVGTRHTPACTHTHTHSHTKHGNSDKSTLSGTKTTRWKNGGPGSGVRFLTNVGTTTLPPPSIEFVSRRLAG